VLSCVRAGLSAPGESVVDQATTRPHSRTAGVFAGTTSRRGTNPWCGPARSAATLPPRGNSARRVVPRLRLTEADDRPRPSIPIDQTVAPVPAPSVAPAGRNTGRVAGVRADSPQIDPGDRRRRVLQGTTRGRRTLGPSVAAPDQANAEVLGTLSQAEHAALRSSALQGYRRLWASSRSVSGGGRRTF
jgi:hypothetical protein